MMLLRITLVSLIILMSSDIMAQASVRNSQETVNTPPQDTVNFAFEIQNMQAEIQALRGQLEQQAFELKRLKQQRLDDYLDLDKRVSELTRQQTENVVSQESSVGGSGIPAVTEEIQLTGSEEEAKALYDEAIDLLLNKQDYTAASAKFDQYLTRYSKGKFVPNIYYWQGQIALGASEKEKATQLFKQLIDEYPQHPKTPDAQFKLARIYFESGKKDEAKVLLDQVASGDSDAALLAKSFLSKNYKQ